MKRIISALFAIALATQCFADDFICYGAWWTTKATAGATKDAGEMVIRVYDYPNAAGLGTVEIDMLMGEQDGSPATVTTHTYYGTWEETKNPAVIKFTSENLPDDVTLRGKINVPNRNTSGNWKGLRGYSGKLQAVRQ